MRPHNTYKNTRAALGLSGLFLALVMLLLLTGLSAHAHENEDTEAPPHPHTRAVPAALKERLELARAGVVERSDRREALREELEARREAVVNQREALNAQIETDRADRKARFEEKRGQLTDRVSKNIGAFVERVEKRSRAALERLENIADRIASRAKNLSERGIDVSETEEALLEARSDLNTARELIADLTTKAEAALESSDNETRRSAFAAVRSAITEIKDILKEVHRHLRDAVSALSAGMPQSGAPTEAEEPSTP